VDEQIQVQLPFHGPVLASALPNRPKTGSVRCGLDPAQSSAKSQSR
jgi:hypothetical protein